MTEAKRNISPWVIPEIKVQVNDAIDRVEWLYKNNYHAPYLSSGLKTGFEKIDTLTGGLQPGSLNVIAALPSMGKTALALNIAEHVAIDQALGVAIFSYQSSHEPLILLMILALARVNLQCVTNGFLNKEASGRLESATHAYAQSKVFLDDKSTPTLRDLEANIKTLMVENKINLIVIDSFDSLLSTWRIPRNERLDEISMIAKGLKALARSWQIPIIVTASLDIDFVKDEKNAPRILGLHETHHGLSVEANLIGFLHRPAYFSVEEDERATEPGAASLIIEKNTDGYLGVIPLSFLSEYKRFESMT